MTEPAPHPPQGGPGRHRVTRIVYSTDLPQGVDALASADGQTVIIRAALDRSRRRAAVHAALSQVRRYPGLAAFPILAGETIRQIARRLAALSPSAAVQQAAATVGEHLTAAVSITAVSVVAVVVGVSATGQPGSTLNPGQYTASGGIPDPGKPLHPVIARLNTKPLSYLGTFQPDAPGNYTGVQNFGNYIGRQPNLALYYSGFHERFQTAFADEALNHGGWPFVQMDPDGVDLQSITSGNYDAYLKAYADEVAVFGHPVVIGFGHEMNAPWAPWGYTHVSPAVWVAAYQHVVNIFRSRNADNVTWVWTVNRTTAATGNVADWWPGSSYVTWVGIDGYYELPHDTFSTVFGATVANVRTFTSAPVLISETAAGQFSGQARAVSDLFTGIRGSGYLGFVWFDKDQFSGLDHQQWRVETDPPEVADEFRRETTQWRLEHKAATQSSR